MSYRERFVQKHWVEKYVGARHQRLGSRGGIRG